MRLINIPNQSSMPKAFLEFDDHDRMKPSAYYVRVIDVMEELVKFTAADLSNRINQRAIRIQQH